MVFNWLSQQIRNVLSPVVQAGAATRRAIVSPSSPASSTIRSVGSTISYMTRSSAPGRAGTAVVQAVSRPAQSVQKVSAVSRPQSVAQTIQKVSAPVVSAITRAPLLSSVAKIGAGTAAQITAPVIRTPAVQPVQPVSIPTPSPAPIVAAPKREVQTFDYPIIPMSQATQYPKDAPGRGVLRRDPVTGIQPAMYDSFEQRARDTGGGFYRTMDDLARGYEKRVGKPYETQFAPQLQRVHENIVSPISSIPFIGKAILNVAPLTLGPMGYVAATNPDTVSSFGKGVVTDTIPGLSRFVGMVPAGAGHLAKEMKDSGAGGALPTFAGYAGAGLGMQATGIKEGLEKDPGRMAGSLVGSLALTRGAMKVPGLAYRGAVRGGTYVSPGYARGVTQYTGMPRIRDVLKREISVKEYLKGEQIRHIPGGKFESILSPKPKGQPVKVYHATDEHFPAIQTQKGGFRAGTGTGKGKPDPIKHDMYFGDRMLMHYLPKPGRGEGAFVRLTSPIYNPYSKGLQQAASRATNIDPNLLRIATSQYLSAPKQTLIPGIKALGGQKFRGSPNIEYMVPSGSKLYPQYNWRTNLYARFGLQRGSQWTRRPVTGERVEIYDYGFTPSKTPLPKPIIDIPALQRRAFYNPVYQQLDFMGRGIQSTIRAPFLRSLERGAERAEIKAMKARGATEAEIASYRAAVDTGRRIKGYRAPEKGDVRLELLKEVGPEYASDLSTILQKHRVGLYGSGTATGQLPKSQWWRQFKDVDLFIKKSDLPKLLVDLEKMYTKHGINVKQVGMGMKDAKTGQNIIDVHEAVPGYPLRLGGKKGVSDPYAKDIPVKPFRHIPDKLLAGEKFVQEYFYTQAQRKLASISEQIAKGGKFKRPKDFGDGIFTVEKLLDHAESTLRPGQVLKARDIRIMRNNLNTIKQDPQIKPLYDAAVQEAVKYGAKDVKIPIDNALRTNAGLPAGTRKATIPEIINGLRQKYIKTEIRENMPKKLPDSRIRAIEKDVSSGKLTQKQADRVSANELKELQRLFKEKLESETLDPAVSFDPLHGQSPVSSVSPASPGIPRIRINVESSYYRDPASISILGLMAPQVARGVTVAAAPYPAAIPSAYAPKTTPASVPTYPTVPAAIPYTTPIPIPSSSYPQKEYLLPSPSPSPKPHPATYPSPSSKPVPYKAPYTPAYPKTPYTPAYPKTPYTPTYPKTPYTPAYPKTPYTPAYPKTPYTPAYPKTPYTPAYPKTPYTPTTYPKTPYTPAYPKTSYTPAYPKTPYTPAYPKTPYEPYYPYSPMAPYTPYTLIKTGTDKRKRKRPRKDPDPTMEWQIHNPVPTIKSVFGRIATKQHEASLQFSMNAQSLDVLDFMKTGRVFQKEKKKKPVKK